MSRYIGQLRIMLSMFCEVT